MAVLLDKYIWITLIQFSIIAVMAYKGAYKGDISVDLSKMLGYKSRHKHVWVDSLFVLN